MLSKLNKLLAAASVVAILATSSFVAFAQEGQGADSPFPDVGSDHENAMAITFMKDNGVFSGYPDGSYQPERVLNRAEQLKVYMLLHGIDPDPNVYKNCFPDVKEDWYARFVCFAKAQGWVVGYPDGTFKPAREVNKVEALKMLGEIQGWDMSEPDEPPFKDTPVGEWYTKYVAFAKDAGLLTEEGENFAPGDGLSRALTAETLFRSLAVYVLESGYSESVDDDILAIDLADLDPIVPIFSGGEPSVAEYGDAPEEGAAGYAGSFSLVAAAFPTLYDTDNSMYGPGAHALDSSMEYLGNGGDGWSYEKDANDAADPDGVMNLVNSDDFDDGVRGLNISLVSIPPPATLTVDVTVDDMAPDVPRYLNVLIDLNMDGEWSGAAAGGEPEWVVQNYAIDVSPGTTETITTDPFAYANGLLLTPTSWMRVVLSREPVDAAKFGADGWDGSGEFGHGEVEDYYLQLPNWDDGSGGIGGGLGGPGRGGRGVIWGKPAPVMVCPKKVHFPDGINSVRFSCGIYNFGGRGDVRYNLWWISGGVAVFPVTGILTMPTAPPGFPPFGVVGNPTRRWFTATRGTTPSTWGYTVVGIDPPSTMEEGIVNLGLVPGDSDEGYSAGGGHLDDLFWTADVDEAYLIEDFEGPVILDAMWYEIEDSGAAENHYEILADVRHPDADAALEYYWSSPSGCGEFNFYDGVLDWFFDDVDAAECMEGGLSLTVSDGEMSDTMNFSDVFEGVEPPVPNQAPAVEYVGHEWLNTIDDDPHIYELTVYASDPDEDALSYSWVSISCGSFEGATSGEAVEWRYVLADMESCSAAEVTVEVSDGEDTTSYTQSVF